MIGVCWDLFMHNSLNSHHSISFGLYSELWLSHWNTSILFFLSHSVIGLLLCFGTVELLHEPVSAKLCQQYCYSLAHLSLEYINFRFSWYKMPSSFGWDKTPYHHPSTTVLVRWGGRADILCLVFTKRGTVHYGKISPLHSKDIWNLVVCCKHNLATKSCRFVIFQSSSAFIDVLKLADDQLIECIWLAASGCYLHTQFLWILLSFPKNCMESWENILLHKSIIERLWVLL